MGCDSYRQLRLEPCANCGKPGSASMNSSTWGHSYRCCSRACGVRLSKKLEHGMGDVHPDHLGLGSLPFYPFGQHGFSDEERIEALRLRIKVLEGQLRHA